MAFAKLVAFDRPLLGATLPGQSGHLYTETEVAEKTEEAYRKGVDAAREVVDQKLVEMRSEMAQLSDGVLSRLAAVEPTMLSQLRDSLPSLAIEMARRLLAGYEPPPAVVDRLCCEALEQLFPEREGLELSLCPRDAGLLEQLKPEWMQRYPGLRVRIDATLAPGDCQVRSRFGLTDARQLTKLTVLAHGLTAP